MISFCSFINSFFFSKELLFHGQLDSPMSSFFIMYLPSFIHMTCIICSNFGTGICICMAHFKVECWQYFQSPASAQSIFGVVLYFCTYRSKSWMISLKSEMMIGHSGNVSIVLGNNNKSQKASCSICWPFYFFSMSLNAFLIKKQWVLPYFCCWIGIR